MFSISLPLASILSTPNPYLILQFPMTDDEYHNLEEVKVHKVWWGHDSEVVNLDPEIQRTLYVTGLPQAEDEELIRLVVEDLKNAFKFTGFTVHPSAGKHQRRKKASQKTMEEEEEEEEDDEGGEEERGRKEGGQEASAPAISTMPTMSVLDIAFQPDKGYALILMKRFVYYYYYHH